MGLRRADTPRTRWTWARRALAPLRGRVRWALTAVVLAALPTVFVVALSGEERQTRLTAEYVRTGSWDTGFSARYILRNTGHDTAHGWTLRFRLPSGADVATLWNGRMSRDGGRYTIRDQQWNRVLRSGESTVVGFEVQRVDPAAPPTERPVDCTINGRDCDGIGSVDNAADRAEPGPVLPRSAPTVPGRTPVRGPLATATGSPSPTGHSGKPTTASPSTGGTTAASGSRVPNPAATAPVRTPVRPYVDLAAPGPYDFAAAVHATGASEWTLAFVVDGGDCRPTWGGGIRLDDPAVMRRFSELRALGGEPAVSFGGAAGTDLAAGCATPEALAAAYRQVVDKYQVTRIDLDVEGRSLGRPDIVERRNQALARLREGIARDGGQMEITYSLPVLPLGLGDDAVALLRDAAKRGVGVDFVNLLAMDYGPANAAEPVGRMGRYATDATRAAHGQLRGVWPRLTDAQTWQMMSVTPMIGVDDVPDEVFTLDDARELARFAAQQHLARLSLWSAGRDRPCATPVTTTDPGCSGVPQEPYAFLRVLQGG